MNNVGKKSCYRKLFLWGIAALMFVCVPGVFAQQAMIQDVAGTVEIKQAGSANWEAAVKGQTLRADTSISTGFKSTAVIVLGETVLTVRPLTRLTLAELSRSQTTEKVSLSLQTGRVKAEVKAVEAGKTEFTVRSSAATASVRGTSFEIDTYNLAVSEGKVEFSGVYGAPVLVDAGGKSYVEERTGRVVPAEQVLREELSPALPLGADAMQFSSRTAAVGAPETPVELIVTIGY